MAEIRRFEAGGYRYVPGPFQYCAGVMAEPGLTIERARFHGPIAMEAGFAAIEAHLRAIGRPRTALCACELRSPAQFTDAEFRAFNRAYVATLEGWGIFADEKNPVARSNVCPEVGGPRTPSFHAFSYTVAGDTPSFVISGSGEANEGDGPYAERIVRLGDTSPEGLTAKARHVLTAMESRMAALATGWPAVTATQAYTVHDLHPLLDAELVRRGAIPHGLTWHFARPPVEGLDFEMDVRGVARELVIR